MILFCSIYVFCYQDRCIVSGYDNGDIKLFDLRTNTIRYETNVANGVWKNACFILPAFSVPYIWPISLVVNENVLIAFNTIVLWLFICLFIFCVYLRRFCSQVTGIEFDRKDIEMNKLVVTTLESKFRVFDMRTQHPTAGFSCLSEKAHKATVWCCRHLPQNR